MFEKIMGLYHNNRREPLELTKTTEDKVIEMRLTMDSSDCHFCDKHKFIDDCQLDSATFYENKDITKGKKNILIIDDNISVVNILLEDFLYFKRENSFDIDEYNIITFSDAMAGFKLKKYLDAHIEFQVDFAIIDLTLKGAYYDEHYGSVVLNGVDVLSMLVNRNKDLRYAFYTGSSFDTGIKYVKDLVDSFHKLFDKEIQDHVIDKSDFDRESRRNKILKCMNGLIDKG